MKTSQEELKQEYVKCTCANSLEYSNCGKKCERILDEQEPKQETQEEYQMTECYFVPSKTTSSATICDNCGKEKFLHTIGEDIKVSKSVIITKEEPKQEDFEYVSIGEERIKIPIQEPNQKTLEEAAENYSIYNEQINKAIQEAVKFGAKWQAEQLYKDDIIQTLEKALALVLKKQERMYREEEVIELLYKREDYINSEDNIFDYKSIKEWFEQFKKK